MTGINSNNNKFNMSQYKITTYTRPLGGRKGLGGLNPFDTQSVLIQRNMNIRAGLSRGIGNDSIFNQVMPTGSNGPDKLTKALIFTQLGLQAGATIAGVVKDFMDIKGKDKPDGLGGDGAKIKSNQTSNSKAAQGMAAADNVVDLRAAIDVAQADYDKLGTEITNIQGSLDKLKEDADKADETIKQKEAEIKTKEQEVHKQEDTVKSYESKRDAAEANLNNIDAAYGKAVSIYNDAKTNTANATAKSQSAIAAWANAEVQYKSTPDTITTPDGREIANPAKEQAKAALDAAEQAKEQASAELDAAKEAEQTAKTELDKAEQELGEAKDAVTEAKKAVDDAQEKLEKAIEDKGKAETELQRLEHDKSSAQGVVQDYKDAQDSLKTKQKEQASLQSEIENQKERLAKLEKEDNNKLTNLKSQIEDGLDVIDGRNSKIDESDGLSRKEKRLVSQNNKDISDVNKWIDQRTTAQSTVDKNNSDALNHITRDRKSEVKGGQVFTTGKNSQGKAIYQIDGKNVTEEEFNRRKG